MRIPKVLTVSRRPAHLCAASDTLASAGFKVVTATNLETALVVGRAIRFDAVFICHHSFTPAERDRIEAELNHANPKLVIIGRCAGCGGCDEAAGLIGRLEDADPVLRVIAALK